jgi:hypothetical protein
VISLAFITPVYRRYDISRVCMLQRRMLCDELEAYGIKATAVYIGDDENIDVARSLGFEVVSQTNEFGLGTKFNDGFEYAARSLQVDIMVPIGSDDWALPEYFADPDVTVCRTSKHLSVVNPQGDEIGQLTHDFEQGINARGFIPWLIPTEFFTATAYRPNYDRRNRGLDADLALGICRYQPRPMWVPNSVDRLQCVDFKNPTTQITPYERTLEMNQGTVFDGKPFELLKSKYPPDLVDMMSGIYNSQKESISA